jgi:hypothetical protein
VADVIERVLNAANARDLEGFVSCYHEQAAIEDGAGKTLARGHAQIRARYGPMFERLPALRVEARSPRWNAGAYVVQEEEVVGRAPDPERHIAIYRVEEGLIAHERLLR